MEFLKIEADDYEAAIKIARQRYGSTVRIHSFKNIPATFMKKSCCELTCYIVGEVNENSQESAKVETPKSIEFSHEVIEKMKNILMENDFSNEVIDSIIGNLIWDDASDLTTMELRIIKSLVDCAKVDNESIRHPKKYFVLHGPTAAGKTISLLKMALLYSTKMQEENRKKVAILSIGGSSNLNSICELYEMDIFHLGTPQNLRHFVADVSPRYDLLFVDFGDIDKDLRDTMLNVLDDEDTYHYLCLNSRYKLSELLHSYKRVIDKYYIKSVVVTMCDEAVSIGNVLSFCKIVDLPILFFSEGKNIEKGLILFEPSYIMSLFKGFSIDFNSMWNPTN